jgi:WD40 repeat protein/tetratricopeptide (TPR) repeat protein
MTDEIVENQMARGTTLTDENKEFLRKIIEQFETFAAITGDDAESRSIRAEGHHRVGLMRYRLGELKEAESAFADALVIRKQLAADFPTRPEFRADLAASHDKMAFVLYETSRLKEAESDFADALAICKQLAADFPTRPEFRQDLANRLNSYGNVLYNTGRQKEGESVWAESVAIQKQLAADFPTRPEFRRDLALSQLNWGVLLGNTGRQKEGESAWVDALAIYKQLAAQFPKVPDYREKAVRTLRNLATLARQQGDIAAERKRWDEMLPYRQSYRNQLRGLTQTCAERGDRAGTVGEAEKGRDRGWDAPADAYDAAAALALCIPMVQKSERRADAPFYADEAMKKLRDAIDKGYHDAAQVNQDKDLDALRERADFQKLLAWLQEPRHMHWSGRHVYSTGFSPDSRYYYATGDADAALKNTTRVWETATGKLVCEVVGNETVAFTPDSKRLLCPGPDKALHLYDLATGQEVRSFKGHTDWVTTVAISPDGKRALSGSNDTTVRVWDLATGTELKKITAHTRSSRALFAPDGKHFLTYAGAEDRTLRLWDAATYKEVRSWVAPGDNWYVAFAPDGPGFLTFTSGDWTVHWWDLKKDKPVRSLRLNANPVSAAGFFPDSRRLIYALASDNTIRLVELGGGKEIARCDVPTVPMGVMAISPDGRFAAGASGNGWVYLWPLPAPDQPARGGDGTVRPWRLPESEVRLFAGHTGPVWGVSFSPDGQKALTTSDDKTVRLWDVTTGQELKRLTGHEQTVLCAAFSPDGRRVVSGSADRTVRLWDTQSGEELKRFDGHEDAVFWVAFSPDGRGLLSAGRDKTIRLWDVKSGKEQMRFVGHTEPVRGVAFSPDGKRILSGSWDKTVRLWDVETGQELRRYEGHTMHVHSVAFSADGSRALSGSRDCTARLWDVETGKLLCELTGHRGEVHAVAFTPDGRHAVTGASDGVRLWDLATGRERHRFEGHGGAVWGVAVSPDGRMALSASDDGTARLWRLPDTDKPAK